MNLLLAFLSDLRHENTIFREHLSLLPSSRDIGCPAPPDLELLVSCGLREEVGRLILVTVAIGDIVSWSHDGRIDLFREAGLTSAASKRWGLFLHDMGYARCVNVPGPEGRVRLRMCPDDFLRFLKDLADLAESVAEGQVHRVGFLASFYDEGKSIFANLRVTTKQWRKHGKAMAKVLRWYCDSALLSLTSLPQEYDKVLIRPSMLEELYNLAENLGHGGGLLWGHYDLKKRALVVEGWERILTSPHGHHSFRWNEYHRKFEELRQKHTIVGEWHIHEDSPALVEADRRKMQALRRGEWLIVSPQGACFYSWRGDCMHLKKEIDRW